MGIHNERYFVLFMYHTFVLSRCPVIYEVTAGHTLLSVLSVLSSLAGLPSWIHYNILTMWVSQCIM